MKIRVILWTTLVLASAAFAAPITYTISTTAGGTFNGGSFSDNTITFTQVSDTSLVGTCFGIDFCPPVSTTNTVSIQGIGTFTVTDSTVFFDNPNGVAGFDDTGVDALTEDDSAFKTYNMQTALGPIFDTADASSFVGISTTGGNLSFTGNSLDATFTAVTGTATPEPGSVGLIMVGAIALLVRRKIL